MFSVESIRKQFPFFQHHPDLCYLDNAATTQKPQVVVDAIHDFYEKENCNIHRGIYPLAAATTEKYEAVRGKVAGFFNAKSSNNIVFTSGTTASINLVVNSFLLPKLKEGDNVVITAMEHHANLIPWQIACKRAGAALRILPINHKGELELTQLSELVDERTKMLSIVHISNTLGTINPIEEIIQFAKQKGIPVLIDGAQSAAHYKIDVQALDCDFFTCSAHKMYGPTGVGILYGKEKYLKEMEPYQFGGDMILDVSFEDTMFIKGPQKFEPGTTNIAGIVGFGAAIDFLRSVNHEAALNHTTQLRVFAEEALSKIKGLKIIGEADAKTSIISFVLDQVHPHDIASFLGAANIAVRAGHHCTQPLMDYLEIPGTIRASLSMYNTKEEIDQLVSEVKNIQKFFS